MNAGALVVMLSVFASCTETQQVLFLPDASVDPMPTAGISHVAAGSFHACAILDGNLWCWGNNSSGELGTGDTTNRDVPFLSSPTSNWLTVAAGGSSTCGIRLDGSVYCWGNNEHGQLGLGTYEKQATPQKVTLPATAKQIAGNEHFCAILVDASMWCWGWNLEGEVTPDAADQPSPVQVSPGTAWRVMDTGQGHTCGIRVDGSLWCWGRNSGKQLGLGGGALIQIRVPTRVGTDTDWVSLSGNQEGTCAIQSNGSLWCWGQDPGQEAEVRLLDPTKIGSDTDWAEVDTEYAYLCARKTSGDVWCWGRNFEGMLGDGTFTNNYVPHVSIGPKAKQLAVGRFFRCQRNEDNVVSCTGNGPNGELGIGNLGRIATPAPVTFTNP